MAEKEIDDRFKKFGTVSFTKTTKINIFVDYLEKGKLMATKCATCGRVFFPPRADCYHSLDSKMEWFEITGTGKLLTYSTLAFAPAGFQQDIPYTIAVLEYGDYRVFGRIDSSVPENELKVGMDMKAAVKSFSNGQLGYFFEKA